jgi:hypothetical protein
MDDLISVMQIIDRYSDKFTEGDYLQLCGKLKKAYDKRSDPVYLFDYENITIPPVGPDEETVNYFYDYYYEKSVDMDGDFLGDQMAYLHREYEAHQPLKRASPKIKEQVKVHFCRIHSLDRTELDSANINKKQFDRTCKTFLYLENDFRAKYRETLERRIRWLELSQDNLETV